MQNEPNLKYTATTKTPVYLPSISSLVFTSQVGRFNSFVWHRLGLVFGTKLSVRSVSAICVKVEDSAPPSVSHEYCSTTYMAGVVHKQLASLSFLDYHQYLLTFLLVR